MTHFVVLALVLGSAHAPRLSERWNFDALPLARVDVPAIVGCAHRAPDSVPLTRRGGRVLLSAGIERADRVLLLDAAVARALRLLDSVSTGKRPEGLLLLALDGQALIVASCEGNDGPGEITFVELGR